MHSKVLININQFHHHILVKYSVFEGLLKQQCFAVTFKAETHSNNSGTENLIGCK